MEMLNTPIKEQAKAVLGAVIAGMASSGGVYITIPEGVSAPWWGYILVALANAGLVYVGVFKIRNEK